MSASAAVRDFIAAVLGAAWRLQFGRWVDGAKTDRYCVIQPVGGAPAELVRQPQFTVTLIGALNEEASVASAAADAVIEAMRAGGSQALVFMQPAEPVYRPADDGRAIFEFAVSAIAT